ncbi:MAG: nucleoside:proton symporter, partial [Deltaproteobacteria bacterium]|nr:nucleoside:proton symporter [Deltaproteobacteria bacterium]
MALQSISGLLVFTVFAWMLSENRKQVRIRTVVTGITIQIVIGLVLLNLSFFQEMFISLNRVFLSLEEATRAGTSMVFGYLGGGELPFNAQIPGSTFILAFQALPLVLLMSA